MVPTSLEINYINPGAMGESSLWRILEATFSPELLIIHWEHVSTHVLSHSVWGSGSPGVYYGGVSWECNLLGDHEKFY